MMSSHTTVSPTLAKRYEITEADLPLCCPLPALQLWDLHPRVFLPISEVGDCVCPYCGAEYFLKKSI